MKYYCTRTLTYLLLILFYKLRHITSDIDDCVSRYKSVFQLGNWSKLDKSYIIDVMCACPQTRQQVHMGHSRL